MFRTLLKLIVVAVIIGSGLIFLKKRKDRKTEEIRRLQRLAEKLAKEDEQRIRSWSCPICMQPAFRRCSRCKLVRYCSRECQKIHWRQGHRNECVESKVAKDEKDSDTKKSLEENEERVRYLEEEELDTSKKEDSLLKSEGNNWSALTNFVSRILNSLMRESDENQIAEEARIVERSKHDEHTQMLESECAKAIKELTEGKEQVRELKLEVEKITTSMRKIEEIRFAERREQEEYIQMLKDGWMEAKRELEEDRELMKLLNQELANTSKNVEYATTRANLAENGWMKAMRELEEEREIVKLIKMECEEIRQSCMSQVEKKEHELVSALNAAAVAEEKLSDLEKELEDKACAICLTNKNDVAFGCGHMACGDCMLTISNCHICRVPIAIRLRLFIG